MAVATLAYDRFGRPKMDVAVGHQRGRCSPSAPGRRARGRSSGGKQLNARGRDRCPAVGRLAVDRPARSQPSSDSHEWVERLVGIRYTESHSAPRIHPEFQNLRVGDEIPYSPFNAIPMVALEPERYLIIGASVALVLQISATGAPD